MEGTYNEVMDERGLSGVQSGLQSGEIVRICLQCGISFTPKYFRANKKNCGNYCSRACSSHAPRLRSTFHTPESTKAERIRANGLVNKRIKLGWFTRPTHCCKCRVKCRTDAHHEDYMQPGCVAFVCRSCHMKAHHDSAYLANVVPINIDHRADGKPIGTGRVHSKGGRCGPIALFNRLRTAVRAAQATGPRPLPPSDLEASAMNALAIAGGEA